MKFSVELESKRQTALARLRTRFQHKEGRAAENRAAIRDIAAQVRIIRRARNWTQPRLALEAGMSQADISRIELAKSTKHGLSVGTLLRIAAAFDVALVVKFAPFSELAEWMATPDEERAVLSYQNELVRVSEQRAAKAAAANAKKGRW